MKRNHCNVCNNDMEFAFKGKILKKHDVRYFSCSLCGYLRTETPFWLEESYSSVIASTDTGILRRNLTNQKLLNEILPLLGNKDKSLIDIGGGYGILTRLLRDIGYDSYHFDPMCENLFAKEFVPLENQKFETALAFEVLEHIQDPLEFFRLKIKEYKLKTIIFSTLLYKKNVPNENWWYYSFETGQHISFYNRNTLKYLAGILGFDYILIKPDIHIFTKVNITILRHIILNNKRLRYLFSLIYKKRKSLTWVDHENAKNKVF